jgi:hypothetical protein
VDLESGDVRRESGLEKSVDDVVGSVVCRSAGGLHKERGTIEDGGFRHRVCCFGRVPSPQHTPHRHCSISALEKMHTIRRSLVATVSVQRGRGRRFESPTSQARWKHYVAGLEGAERHASPFCWFLTLERVYLFFFFLLRFFQSVVHETGRLEPRSRAISSTLAGSSRKIGQNLYHWA